MSYELLDHTADIKIKVSSKDISSLFEECARAFSSYVSPGKKVSARVKKKILVSGKDMESLLYNFLEELIYLIDAEHFVVSGASLKLRDFTIEGHVLGDVTSKYELKQVKSPTYAEMNISKTKNVCVAQFVLDV